MSFHVLFTVYQSADPIVPYKITRAKRISYDEQGNLHIHVQLCRTSLHMLLPLHVCMYVCTRSNLYTFSLILGQWRNFFNRN